MKQSPDEKTVAERMAPGMLTRDGFLGDDPRSLAEIIDADSAAVARLGLSHGEIARRLGEAASAAVAGLGTPVRFAAHLVVVYREAMGYLPCPWGGCGTFGKGEFRLTDDRTGRTLLFTPLSVHMIAAHGFYEGRGSPYRLEPSDLAEMLGLGGGAGVQ